MKIKVLVTVILIIIVLAIYLKIDMMKKNNTIMSKKKE